MAAFKIISAAAAIGTLMLVALHQRYPESLAAPVAMLVEKPVVEVAAKGDRLDGLVKLRAEMMKAAAVRPPSEPAASASAAAPPEEPPLQQATAEDLAQAGAEKRDSICRHGRSYFMQDGRKMWRCRQ